MAKNLIFVFNPKTGALSNTLEMADPLATSVVANNQDHDVPNPGGVNDPTPNPEGRRYGQFIPVVTGPNTMHLIIMGHSVPSTNNGASGLWPLYTVLSTPIDGVDGESVFAAPIPGWQGVNPDPIPSSVNPYTTYYQYFKHATKKADEKTQSPPRFTFFPDAPGAGKGKLLEAGTPPNGVIPFGGEQGILVSDAPSQGDPYVPTIHVLSVATGREICKPFAGAVALDVLPPLNPAAVLAWGGLQTNGTPTLYQNGHLQVLVLQNNQLVPSANASFGPGSLEQPVLFAVDDFNKQPENIGFEGRDVAYYLATADLAGSGVQNVFFTYAGNGNTVNAYDANTFHKVMNAVPLGKGAFLRGIASTTDFPLKTMEPVTGTSVFIIEEGNSILLKQVSSDYTHFVTGVLA